MRTVAQALALAVQQHQAGQLPQAEQIYRAILEVEPQQVDALHLLGVLAHQVGQYEQARAYIDQALRLNPDLVEAHLNLGQVLKEQGQLEQARASLQQALHLQPDLAEAHNNLGNLLLEQGNLAEAQASLQQALRLEPKYAVAHNNLGNVLQKQGRLAQALACYEQALRYQPDYAEAHNNLGAVLQKQGQLAEARASLQQALRLKPDFAEAHLNLGHVLQEQGQLAGAQVSYQQALRYKPNYPEAHNNLGVVLRKHGKFTEARANYQQALRLKPDYAEAYYNLGNLLREQGELAEAQASYQQALRLQPDFAEAHNNLGNVFKDQGELAEAQACYEQALHRKPDYAEAHNNLANALREQGQLAEALASYRQALHLKPDYAEAYSNLGAALKEQGKFVEAQASLQQALHLKPDYAEAFLNLGSVLQDQGRLAEAQANYQQALCHQPDYAEAHHNLGTVLQGLGRLDEAVACYQQALRLQPDYAEAQINLSKAYRDQGKLEEAAAGFQLALRLRPSPRLRIERATLLPPLYASTAELHTWRARLQDNLAQLHREHVTLDLTQESARPLFYLAYQGGNDRDIQCDLARLYIAPPEASGRFSTGRRSGDGRIHVGFISRFFRNHTIGELFRGIIAHLDRDAFTVTVFSLGHYHDALAQFIQAHADTYVRLPLNLRVARQQIAAQQLDVLLYPDIGMDELTYSLAFSRLAPVQCVSWGHPLTTGIPTIDYYLSSELFETPLAEQHYTETLVRLPELPCYCYRVTPPFPLRGRDYFGLPADSHLYACPQPVFKFHPDLDALLGGILRQDPRGLLVLNQLRQGEELLQQRFAATLADVRERIRFLPRLSHEEYLNLNAISDVMLDTLHFNGGNTSLKALALGVPIVTLPSAYLRGRLTLALYKKMQVLDCVAATPADYIERAVRLGTEPDYRAHLRAKILQANGVLYENLAGVRALEEFLRSAVQRAG